MYFEDNVGSDSTAPQTIRINFGSGCPDCPDCEPKTCPRCGHEKCSHKRQTNQPQWPYTYPHTPPWKIIYGVSAV